MPELPEVETVSRTLARSVVGKVIAGFELHWPRSLDGLSPEAFQSRTAGASIVATGRRGKLVLLRLDTDDTVSVHLRMTGELLFDATNALDPARSAYLRALFQFADGSRLAFYDTRKFGRISLLDPNAFAALDAILGPEPLSPQFTPELLAERLHSRSRAIKPLLLDQTFIAGLGNIYVDEALHAAGIHPLAKSNQLTDAQVQRLHASIVSILTAAVESHGTTLQDYRDGAGQRGTYGSRLRIYGSPAGSPCRVCSTPIERLIVGQRGTVYCPQCQALPEYHSSI